ncbi:MAG: hypothetical protein IT323_13450 [Anaerolineae bacterium]|nr:hypothetical protein [Anaerolineae bacterium]
MNQASATVASDYTVHAPNAYCQRAARRLIALMMEKRRERGKLNGSRISVSFHGRRISFSYDEHLGEEVLSAADCPDDL